MFTGFAISALLIDLALTTTGHTPPDAGGREHRAHPVRRVSDREDVGAAEFLPIVAIALLLTSDDPAETSLLLVLLVALAAGAGAMAIRPTPPRVVELLGARSTRARSSSTR